MIYLGNFAFVDPPYHSSQAEALDWLAQAYCHFQNGKYSLSEVKKLFDKVACSSQQIGRRYSFLKEYKDPFCSNSDSLVTGSATGASIDERNQFFQRTVEPLFEKLYIQRDLVDELIHVTCTGYFSPSAGQRLVSNRAASTLVSHCYHMGCYAAFPAIRQAAGSLQNSFSYSTSKQVDIVHTELCTLHFSLQKMSPEQIVIHSLFSDGVIAYRLGHKSIAEGFCIHSMTEATIPNTSHYMHWVLGSFGMQMGLSHNVPSAVAEFLPNFLNRWLHSSSRVQYEREAAWAIHPGGPKILDMIQDKLRLEAWQIACSRKVLSERGNMSSATLPFIWREISADASIPKGCQVVSLAFGPGLTISASLMEKI